MRSSLSIQNQVDSIATRQFHASSPHPLSAFGKKGAPAGCDSPPLLATTCEGGSTGHAVAPMLVPATEWTMSNGGHRLRLSFRAAAASAVALLLDVDRPPRQLTGRDLPGAFYFGRGVSVDADGAVCRHWHGGSMYQAVDAAHACGRGDLPTTTSRCWRLAGRHAVVREPVGDDTAAHGGFSSVCLHRRGSLQCHHGGR